MKSISQVKVKLVVHFLELVDGGLRSVHSMFCSEAKDLNLKGSILQLNVIQNYLINNTFP